MNYGGIFIFIHCIIDIGMANWWNSRLRYPTQLAIGNNDNIYYIISALGLC